MRRVDNRTRPTNSFRLMASPFIAISLGNIEKHEYMEPGYAEIPRMMLRRAKFVHLSEGGLCTPRRLKVADYLGILLLGGDAKRVDSVNLLNTIVKYAIFCMPRNIMNITTIYIYGYKPCCVCRVTFKNKTRRCYNVRMEAVLAT